MSGGLRPTEICSSHNTIEVSRKGCAGCGTATSPNPLFLWFLFFYFPIRPGCDKLQVKAPGARGAAEGPGVPVKDQPGVGPRGAGSPAKDPGGRVRPKAPGCEWIGPGVPVKDLPGPGTPKA